MLELVMTKMAKPRPKLVRCLMTLVLKQLFVLLGEGLINFGVLFQKILKLS